jgi:hypothetical protein
MDATMQGNIEVDRVKIRVADHEISEHVALK